MGEVGWHCDNCRLVVEVVLLDYQLQLVQICCEDLDWLKGLRLPLVFNLEGNLVALGHAFGRTELFFASEEGVLAVETKEAGWEGDRIFPVGLNLDVARFSNLSFGCSIAHDAGGLSKVGLVGD